MQTILIIDEDSQFQNTLSHTFKNEGFNVLTASNGIDGLQKAISSAPDLILLDLILPGMDGTTMLNELRKDDIGKKLSVIILTNMKPDKEEIEKVMVNRPCYYLMKTVPLSEVVDKVKIVLKIKPAEKIPVPEEFV